MAGLETPTVVMPLIYELPIAMWRWCKLTEVCAIIPQVAIIVGNTYAPTPEQLVHEFAGLVRPNQIPNDQTSGRKKIFRYSRDGSSFWGTEVPTTGKMPPYEKFELELGVPYPEGMFVPEGWVIDTLKAIRMGAVAAVDFDGRKIGFGPKGSANRMFDLEPNKGGSFIARLPT